MILNNYATLVLLGCYLIGVSAGLPQHLKANVIKFANERRVLDELISPYVHNGIDISITPSFNNSRSYCKEFPKQPSPPPKYPESVQGVVTIDLSPYSNLIRSTLQPGLWWVSIHTKSSDCDEIWEYDVPPTPHTSFTTIDLKNAQHDGGSPIDGQSCDSLTFSSQYESNGRNASHQVFVLMDLPIGCHVISPHLVTDNGQGLKVHTVLPSALVSFCSSWIGGRDFDSATVLARMRDKKSRKLEETRKWNEDRTKVSKQYTPKHPQLYQWDPQWLHHDLRDALHDYHQDGKKNGIALAQNISELRKLEGAADVFILPVFSETYMELLHDELSYANMQSNVIKWNRPNTMNNFGFMVEELGMKQFFDGFVSYVVEPLASALLPDWSQEELDSHHVFTLRYAKGEDTNLKRHLDLSQVTMNVCIGRDFEGAEVFFDGQREHPNELVESVTVEHKVGYALFHAGQHWHGTNTLTRGIRENLVIWGRSSKFQSSAAEIFNECWSEQERVLKRGTHHTSQSSFPVTD